MVSAYFVSSAVARLTMISESVNVSKVLLLVENEN
jgi:hypothetical protein